MTIQEFLDAATGTLTQAGIATARLDALVILEDALGQERAWLLAHPDAEIPTKTEVNLNTKIVHRAQHRPLAYIRGKVEFYGREFAINEHVLVPRPETETMIDLLKTLDPRLYKNNALLVDLGTGSGAIAVTAKLEFPSAEVIAGDIDPEALKIARQNAKKLRANVKFLQGDLLEPTPHSSFSAHPSVILANLPYVPERYAINQAAEYEPKHAIFGGNDGLNLYRRSWEQIGQLPESPLFVLTESLPPQHDNMRELARNAGFTIHKSQDFIQVFKRS